MKLLQFYEKGVDINMEEFIMFNINKQMIAINMLNILKIIKLPQISHVLNSPEHIEGVIDFQDNVIPVLNLKKKFNFIETNITEGSSVLVINDENDAIGIIVDSVDEIVEIDPVKITKNMSNQYVYGVAKVNNCIINLLNTSKLVHESSLM